MAQYLAIDGPAGRAQLIVDQDAGRGLIEFDLFGLLAGKHCQEIKVLGRRSLCLGLCLLEGGFGFSKSRLGLCCIAFPELAVLAMPLHRAWL